MCELSADGEQLTTLLWHRLPFSIRKLLRRGGGSTPMPRVHFSALHASFIDPACEMDEDLWVRHGFDVRGRCSNPLRSVSPWQLEQALQVQLPPCITAAFQRSRRMH